MLTSGLRLVVDVQGQPEAAEEEKRTHKLRDSIPPKRTPMYLISIDLS